MQKIPYICPITEVVSLSTARLMALGDPSNAGEYGGSGGGAPQRYQFGGGVGGSKVF